MEWIKVSGPLSPSQDFIKPVKAGDKTLVLICSNGNFFASQLYCPHAGADLSDGWCKNGKLVCPHHRFEYDLLTGKGNPLQGDYITMYKVESRADGVYIGFGEKKGFWKRLFG